MKFSILGPGGIAHSMAKAVKGLEGVEAYAVASRAYERAKEFADKWGYQKAYGSYEELVQDPEVELVYIATPHSHHYQYAKLCLEHGKHVLVEKAFTVNARQAQELIELGREKHLLVAEAMWTRYMPMGDILKEVLESGMIGEPMSITSSFGFPLTHVERLVNPHLAGGALLDLGIYPITAALMTFPGEIKNVQTTAVMSEAGVDLRDSITLIFEGGQMAILYADMTAVTDCKSVIMGTKGYLELPVVNNWTEIRVFDKGRRLVKTIPAPPQINGYEYEVLACKEALKKGELECAKLPHTEIIRVMKLMDQIREAWGMKLPCE